jgi:hypothetical protein
MAAPLESCNPLAIAGILMQYLLLVYVDPVLMEKVPPATFNAEMRQCLQHADELTQQGTLTAFQQLEPPVTARTLRVRDGRTSIVDGPFAETKELLAGFNLVEAASLDEALRLARDLPWAKYGSIEVRPVADIAAMRQRVTAATAQ